MKNLGKREHRLIRPLSFQLLKERRHLALPFFVDGFFRHSIKTLLKVVTLQIPNQQSILAQKQRIIPPSRTAQRIEHLRPDVLVATLVFLETIGLHFEQKTDARHRLST